VTFATFPPSIDQRLGQLLAQLPLAPLKVLAPFVETPTSTLHRHVEHLVDAGLIGSVASPLPGHGRPGRLLYLSRDGLSATNSDGVEPSGLARKLALRGGDGVVPRIPREWPKLLAAYELLSLLAARGPGSARLCRWEWPWRRIVPRYAGTRKAPLVVRLPAGAAVTWITRDGTVTREYVLLPDTGGLAMPAIRAALGHLARYHATSEAPPRTLAIATTTSRRAAGWEALVNSVCSQRGLPRLNVEIPTWTELRHAAVRVESRSNVFRESPRSAAALRNPRAHPPVEQRTCLPPPGRNDASQNYARLGQLDYAVLELIARHPFLPTAMIGDLLGDRDAACARTRRAALLVHELVRVVPGHEVEPPALARLGLLETTRAGLEMVAAQVGLPLMAAVHHHGLAGGGPDAPLGPRAALLRHLPHTLGADRVFATIARAARTHPSGGALLEWRGPAACAHGRLRPDGYGLLRLGAGHYGFFLEFDRGSMHAGRLRGKFAAYHRYAASTEAARSYAGFPTVLVVCTSPGGEQRIARAVAASDVGCGRRLAVLLTTTGWLDGAPAGPRGAVWRTAWESTRRTWASMPFPWAREAASDSLLTWTAC
jgi:Replication-relaxation